MSKTEFVHIHNHSEYSLLDGMTFPEEMAEITALYGSPAFGVTDHGTMAAVLRAQEAAIKHGVKALPGIEAYYVPSIADDNPDEKYERFHLILIAKNDDGLQKLFKINKKSWQRPNFYKKPRIEWADLEHLGGDVVCLSGCMASYLSRLLIEPDGTKASPKDIGRAERVAQDFLGLFGTDYYLELQPWNNPILNGELIRLGDSFNIPLIGTLDCHYPTKQDRPIEEVLLMMGQMPGLNAAKTRYAKDNAHEARFTNDLVEKMNIMYPDRFLKFGDIAVYLQSPDEVVTSFKDAGYDIPELFSNTIEVADKCGATIKTKQNLLPKFSKTLKSDVYLRELAQIGLEDRGFSGNQEYIDRLKEELETIIDLGFADYFLIVWDIIAWARNQGIPVGQGRGSVGGCLLAYCLKITGVDPIKHGCLFSRFLNKERVSWPDIDMDFGTSGREKVKGYMKKKWGSDNVASIATYSVFKPKGLVKSYTSVMQVPYTQANQLSTLFETIDELKASKKGKEFLQAYPETLTLAERLEGRIKGTGVHAAGVVVASKPLWQVCPVETRNPKEDKDTDRVEVIALDMDQAELIGLLKFDILGVLALDVINDCILKIKEKYGRDVEDITLQLDDPAVYSDISSGHTVGVFQAEATAYRNLILEMGISNFSDLSASNALVRPGAFLTQGEQYVACKNKGRAPHYVHEVLKPYLEETYGTVVYQEQLMQVAEHLAGFSQFEADNLRKIIGKKRDVAEFLPFKEKFITGASKYVTEKVAEGLWDDLEKTATYMFNKSHAVGYSITSYQTAWLKHHYPTEYVWAMLKNEDDSSNIATYLLEANRLGVKIEGPDVNISEESFTLDGDTIRFGLKNVSGCGPAAIKEIMLKRPFGTLEEMQNKCRKTAVKSTLYDNFDKLGAYKSMGIVSLYDSKKYWLKLLNCAIHADDNFLGGIIKPIGEVNTEDKTSLSVIRGMVKSTKRKPNYFRVEFEDTSGSVSVFGNLNFSVKAREYLIALVGDKTLHAFADASMAEDDFDDPLIQFLRSADKPFIIPNELAQQGINGLDSDISLVRIISQRYFKTKTQKIMANAWIYDPVNQDFKKVVIFSQVYGKHSDQFVPWNWAIIRHSQTKDGGIAIDDIIDLPSYCKLKGIEIKSLAL